MNDDNCDERCVHEHEAQERGSEHFFSLAVEVFGGREVVDGLPLCARGTLPRVLLLPVPLPPLEHAACACVGHACACDA